MRSARIRRHDLAPRLPVIFEMFRQGDSSDTRSYGGVGLGLYIVREVMARHGGSLSLQPRQPHGLVARLVFPQAQAVPA